MVAGAGVQALAAIGEAANRDDIRARTIRLADELQGRRLSGAALDTATSQAYWFTVLTASAFAVLWLIVAYACAKPLPWGRGVATFLTVVFVFTYVFSGSLGTSWQSLLNLALCIIGVAVVYLLWRRPVGAWMTSLTPPASLPDEER